MRIIYFKTKDSTFILRDQKILEKNFETKAYSIDVSSGIAYFFALIKLTIFLLFFSGKYDTYYIRFADWHTAILAFFARIQNKKLFVVIGGYDVACIPEIKYGAHKSKYRSRFIKYTLRNSTCLIPNSYSLIYYENKFINDKIIYGGIKYFGGNDLKNIRVIPNGFDASFWRPDPNTSKRNLIITVAIVHDLKTFYLKGIDQFIACAKEIPDYEFWAVGLDKSILLKSHIEVPGNFKPIGKKKPEELVKIYSEARIFCLFSLSEGMPNVLCEAMLCNCIPVGSQVTSIPEIIGESGFLVNERTKTAHLNAINLAIERHTNLINLPRERIRQNYSMELRERDIVDLIKYYGG